MSTTLAAAPLVRLAADAGSAAGHPIAGDGRLITALLVGIAVIIVLITKFKLHPFLSLTIGSGVLAAVAGVPFDKLTDSYTTGLGSTVASTGVLIALGGIIGKLLADSGGADRIADTVLARTGKRGLPWAMALIAAVLGLPLFFEVGMVLLIPIVLLVAKRGNYSVVRVGIPALAGLSVLHGLVPPHPGPLVAIAALKANLGMTLLLGIVVAIPTLIIAGPLYGKLAARWVGDVQVPENMVPKRASDELEKTPSFGATLSTILLPVVLMLAKAVCDLVIDNTSSMPQRIFDFLGSPLVALLITALVAMFTLGRAAGFTKGRIAETTSAAMAPMSSVILIVGAGGGFKQVLVDIGVGQVIANWADQGGISVLLLAWLIAVAIRLATGSATVATVTAAGIVAPMASGLSPAHLALVVLAVGCGSLFLSHVNDAGFWLVKEYFGMSVGQTFKSWSIMETVISVVGMLVICLLNLVV